MNERVPWQGWRRKGEDAGLPAAKGPGSRRPFGATWWGRAWLEALEHRARLDPNRLSRGRSYARRGSVLELTVSPGEVEAVVQGSRVTPYQVTVRIRAFTTAEWDAVLDVVSSQIGRVAALLDGELPPEVVDDVHAAGLDLLPGAGEVHTNCSCPDFAVPCKHSAAVCYLVADALDDDPFALLLLRGRPKTDLLSSLRARRSTTTSTTLVREAPPPGLLAKTAFGDTLRPAVPVAPRPMGAAGVPAAVQALDPPRSSGVEVRDLVVLATDAARRAWEFASGDGDGGLQLTSDQDLARRAAGLLGAPELADLAHRAGVSARQLTSWAVAWREGGPGGLAATVDEPTDVAPEALAEGLDALGGTVEGNRITAGRIQLRLGSDGLWYRFDQQFSDWTLTRPPSPDPQELTMPAP
ncbi:SWIM zinc finger family protein [Kribbella sp. NPDC050124]|uniref:SWIM zinc finger family protein n=1 Tax=Kribbella sp. NPDC050124 TaxID=3364114 RepID=UPI0037A8C0B9